MEFNFDNEPGKILLSHELNTSQAPLVSIITPFYNAGAYFEQTFMCVINQTFPYFEWIIVDDGSTNPNDLQLLEEYKKKDNRIKLFHKTNGGVASARNYAIEKSKTEYIVPLDADDLITPTYLEMTYTVLQFHPSASWAYTDSVGFQKENYLWKKEFSSEMMKVENRLVCTAMIRKKDFIKVGCYEVHSTHYDEDWLAWLRLMKDEKYPVHINEYGFWYRRTDQGALLSMQRNEALRNASRKVMEEAGKDIKHEIKAIEYPVNSPLNGWETPKLSCFKGKVKKQQNKIHILMILPWLEMGGADLFNLDIVKYIDKSRFQISIITTVRAKHTWRERFEKYTSDIFHLPNFLEVKNYAEFISYMILSREIDIVFLSNSYYGYYLLPWLRNYFPELSLMDYVHMEEWYWRNGGYARTSGVFGNILDQSYTCNEKTRKILIHDFSRNQESVKTLYIGVNEKYFDEETVSDGNVRKMFGISSERPLILFPCRIHPQKRPFLMLEIARELKKQMPTVAFLVVGDGPQLQELRNQTEQSGLCNTVYFAGRQDDMRNFYKDSQLTLICSIKEGLALTAYESCSMKTPVVTADVGGQAELVDSTMGAVIPFLQDESKDLDARSFDKKEIMDYVEAIVGILSDKKKYDNMAKQCRREIVSKFSKMLMIQTLEAEIEHLITDMVQIEQRRYKSKAIQELGFLSSDYLTAYCELEHYENLFQNAQPPEVKNELLRIMNSKWGSRLVRIAFKLKLNRLFK